jgi:hypothetical protein
MANVLGAFTPEYWSRRSQILLKKSLVGTMIASMEERETLRNGDTVHRPYHSDPYVVDYVKGTSVNIQDITTTDETLVIDQSKVVGVYVDDDDMKQNKYETANLLIDRSTHMLAREMDFSILSKASDSALTVDDGTIGGTAGNPIALSTTNAVNTFSTAKAELASNNVEHDKDWFLVVDPKTVNVITQTFIANGFNTADLSLRNGFLGDWLGFKVFESNALKNTTVLGIATNPTDGDTFTIKGVTFTFKTVLAAAGDILIGAAAADSVDNAVAAINGAAGAGSLYTELSAANRATISNQIVSAVDGTTIITITAAGDINPSETLTAGADGFSGGKVEAFAGRMGAVDFVAQIEPQVNIKDVQDKLGKNFLSHSLYGTKMFNEGAQRSTSIELAK